MILQKRQIADLVYWTLIGVTAANYSFVTHAFDGSQISNDTLKLLAYARLPIALMGFWLLPPFPSHTRYRMRGDWLIFLLIGSALLAIPWSPVPSRAALYGAWFILQLVFIARYCQFLVDKHGYEKAAIKLTIPLMLMGLYFLILTLAGIRNYVPGRPFVPIYAEMKQVAAFAPIFLGGLACCYSAFKRRRILAWPLIGMAVFCLVVIATSGKRAAIICGALILGAYFIFKVRPSRKVMVFSLTPLIAITLATVGFLDIVIEASEFTLHRIDKGLQYETATSINERLYIWGLVFEIAAEKPLGVGLAVLWEVIGEGPHSTYLGFLVETGWLSFVAFCLLVLVSIFTAFRTSIVEKKHVLLFIGLPCLVYSLTEYHTAPGQPLFIPLWVGLCFALLPTASRLRKNHITRRKTRQRTNPVATPTAANSVARKLIRRTTSDDSVLT